MFNLPNDIKITGGYVVDKNIGNTGGLGGVFGLLHAIDRGFSFPEAKPWKPSLRFRLFTLLGNLINMLPTVEDITLGLKTPSISTSKVKEVNVEKPSEMRNESSTLAH